MNDHEDAPADLDRRQEALRSDPDAMQLTAVVTVSLPFVTALFSGQRARITDLLEKRIGSSVRVTDLSAVLPSGGFAVFLPRTGFPGAQIVAARLAQALDDFGPDIGIAVSETQTDHVEALIDRTLEDARARQASHQVTSPTPSQNWSWNWSR